MKNEPMTEDEIKNVAAQAVEEAVAFVEAEISQDRVKAQRYFNGECDVAHDEGRSKVVATKVRDTIRQIKPSLMRVFLSSENYVEFVPGSPQDIPLAETATKYIHAKFSEQNGFSVLSDAIHDALLKKAGIVKCYWDESEESETHEYTNLTQMELMVLASEPEVEIIEHESILEETPEGPMETHAVKLVRTVTTGQLVVESVPPEEFFVDRNARSIHDCYVCGHRTEMTASDLIEMGYDPEVVESISGIAGDDSIVDEEEFARRGFDSLGEEDPLDESMRKVSVSEAYMKIDVDGTGIAQMHRVLLAGGDNVLLDYEPCAENPFAVFECDPEPHTFFGRSVADLILEDQDAATVLLRGILDNVAATNNPRTEALEGAVNMDDLLNNEIGAIVRVKQSGATREIAVPFVAGQTLGAMEYYDQNIERKTGVSRASSGLDPDALQNSTATAAQITAQAAAGQIEVIARNMAEGGMTQLFRNMLRLLIENSVEPDLIRLNGQFVPIDPRSWDADMGVSVNVGLGTGREEQRAAVLQATLEQQMGIYQGYGPQNGIVGLTNIRNTLADILALGGLRNSDRYYQPMSPEIEQQIIAQQQQAAEMQAQQQVDQQAQAIVQAETIKAQQKSATDQLKIQLDAQKALAEDDRKRDEMDQELLLKAAELLGEYDIQVDTAKIKAMQAAPRYPNQAPAQAATGARY